MDYLELWVFPLVIEINNYASNHSVSHLQCTASCFGTIREGSVKVLVFCSNFLLLFWWTFLSSSVEEVRPKVTDVDTGRHSFPFCQRALSIMAQPLQI